MPKRLSFQLYSARKFPLAETLALLARIGYQEVEGYGGVYDDPTAMRAALEQTGLTMPSGHFSLDMLESEKAKVVAIASALGMRHLYCPYVAAEERPKTAAGWRKFGKRLAAAGAWARSEGYGFGWHNHDFEFARLPDGSVALEVLFEAAPMIDWECDVAWIARAGVSPVKWIKAYADRITAVHVKDIAPKGKNVEEDGWVDVGEGTLGWQQLFGILSNSRALHFIVEHDNPGNLERFAKRSFANAVKM
jgi:sugar phosphate isomerase/epimerase